MSNDSKSWEAQAVDEIIEKECETENWQRDFTCPCCQRELKVETDGLLHVSYQFCVFCGWESQLYYHGSEYV